MPARPSRYSGVRSSEPSTRIPRKKSRPPTTITRRQAEPLVEGCLCGSEGCLPTSIFGLGLIVLRRGQARLRAENREPVGKRQELPHDVLQTRKGPFGPRHRVNVEDASAQDVLDCTA